jgi:hypothetical protein
MVAEGGVALRVPFIGPEIGRWAVEGARPTAVNSAVLCGGRKWGGETGSRGDEGGGGDVSLCHGRGGGAVPGR